MTSDQEQGPLAEFTSLRGETAQLLSFMQNLFAFQITTAGTIFSLALSNPTRTRLLLILPFTSYALFARYSSCHFNTLRIAQYVRDELSPRVSGGLRWEQWLDRSHTPVRFIVWVNPHYVAFPGVAALSEAWTLSSVFPGAGLSISGHVLFLLVWAAGLSATIVCFYLVWLTTTRARGLARTQV
ncbi:hypothetical protein C5E45_23675 [Nocardia nova]|uniref:Uncharacterized protein n=1 Tax=Nocardia nova TaxID=37330 RepID=A0A2S6AKT6_9NOCA|nr:hypothetical protein [Nocardia nova]PPJ35813.1 hypothetical protein C5E45_23675 [Nocardia nova]